MATQPLNDDWQDEESWVDEPEVSNPDPVTEQPGFFSKSWHAISDPLTDLGSRTARKVANWMDTPELDDSGLTARLKGFAAGATEGAGEVLDSFTSPINLAGMALTGGASAAAGRGLGAVAKGLSAASVIPDALSAAHGAGETFGSNRSNSERLMGLAEMLGGGAGTIAGVRGTLKPHIPIEEPAPMRLKKEPERIPERVPEKVPAESDIIPTGAVDDWIDEEIDNALKSSPKSEVIPGQPKPIEEVLPEPVAPKPILRPQEPRDYSVAAEQAAREKLIAAGARPEDLMGLSNKQIIDAANPPSTKPKLKVKLNPVTNTLEPDLSDPTTATIFKSAKTNEPVPQHERLDPDKEIDLDEAWAMAEGKQPELGLENPNAPLPKAKAPNPIAMKNASQGELGDNKGSFRQPAPDKFMPGGKPSEPLPPPTKTQEWLGLPRAIQSAFDLSFPLRQGISLIHTKGWWKAWPDMIKAFGDEAAYKGLMDSIAARENFRGKIKGYNPDGTPIVAKSLAQEAGLDLTDLGSHREENITSLIAEKIPGVKNSNRAYNAFANKLRADTFDELIRNNPEAKTNIVLAKELANYVNNASGRGKLPGKDLESAAGALNNMLFSPRLMASRIQMLNPKNYIFTRPEVRKEYLKSMMGLAGTWAVMAGLGKAAGAEVSLDPESTEFGKMKFGNTRLDPAAGFQQYIVLATRIAKGMHDGKDGRYSGKAFAPTPGSDLWNFIENKLSPNASYLTGPIFADKRRPFSVGDESARMFTPMILQDLSEILQDNPRNLPAVLPGLVGVGSNTYSPGKQDSTLLGWNRKKDWNLYPSK